VVAAKAYSYKLSLRIGWFAGDALFASFAMRNDQAHPVRSRHDSSRNFQAGRSARPVTSITLSFILPHGTFSVENPKTKGIEKIGI
jgi:hypothetical protein